MSALSSAKANSPPVREMDTVPLAAWRRNLFFFSCRRF